MNYERAAGSFEQTSLKEKLDNRDITHLVIVGVRTEFCIATTCRAATTLGFKFTLVEDGHTTVDGEIPAEKIITQYNETLSKTCSEDRFISVVPVDKILFS